MNNRKNNSKYESWNKPLHEFEILAKIGNQMIADFSGGEEETRTPAPVSRPTPLAGEPRHQLEYFSIVADKKV